MTPQQRHELFANGLALILPPEPEGGHNFVKSARHGCYCGDDGLYNSFLLEWLYRSGTPYREAVFALHIEVYGR